MEAAAASGEARKAACCHVKKRRCCWRNGAGVEVSPDDPVEVGLLGVRPPGLDSSDAPVGAPDGDAPDVPDVPDVPDDPDDPDGGDGGAWDTSQPVLAGDEAWRNTAPVENMTFYGYDDLAPFPVCIPADCSFELTDEIVRQLNQPALDYVNEQRQLIQTNASGDPLTLGVLEYSPHLAHAAMMHAADMMLRGYGLVGYGDMFYAWEGGGSTSFRWVGTDYPNSLVNPNPRHAVDYHYWGWYWSERARNSGYRYPAGGDALTQEGIGVLFAQDDPFDVAAEAQKWKNYLITHWQGEENVGATQTGNYKDVHWQQMMKDDARHFGVFAGIYPECVGASLGGPGFSDHNNPDHPMFGRSDVFHRIFKVQPPETGTTWIQGRRPIVYMTGRGDFSIGNLDTVVPAWLDVCGGYGNYLDIVHVRPEGSQERKHGGAWDAWTMAGAEGAGGS